MLITNTCKRCGKEFRSRGKPKEYCKECVSWLKKPRCIYCKTVIPKTLVMCYACEGLMIEEKLIKRYIDEHGRCSVAKLLKKFPMINKARISSVLEKIYNTQYSNGITKKIKEGEA